MTKEEIYNKAVAIIDLKRKEKLHNEKCGEAEICPECGEELIKGKYNGEYSFDICKNNHESNKYYFNDDDDDY